MTQAKARPIGAAEVIESAPATEHPREAVKRPRKRKPPVFISIADPPPLHALFWRSNKEKAHKLHAWGLGIRYGCPEHNRAQKVAWVLEHLFGKYGYAFCSDAYLGVQSSVPTKYVANALATLESMGGILRFHVKELPEEMRRRIYPCKICASPYLPGGEFSELTKTKKRNSSP
jgi:hypothetical protein